MVVGAVSESGKAKGASRRHNSIVIRAEPSERPQYHARPEAEPVSDGVTV